jgi:hypothetical protein
VVVGRRRRIVRLRRLVRIRLLLRRREGRETGLKRVRISFGRVGDRGVVLMRRALWAWLMVHLRLVYLLKQATEATGKRNVNSCSRPNPAGADGKEEDVVAR